MTDLVECPECGREGLAARIEKTDCPHYRANIETVTGP